MVPYELYGRTGGGQHFSTFLPSCAVAVCQVRRIQTWDLWLKWQQFLIQHLDRVAPSATFLGVL